jgi:hypothetical protein
METREITPEQIVMIIVFVAIPVGLIGLIVLFSFASCCGYQIAVISPKTSRLDDDTSSSSGTIGYKHEYDVHDDESTDNDLESNAVKTPPKRYSLIRFISNGNNKNLEEVREKRKGVSICTLMSAITIHIQLQLATTTYTTIHTLGIH